jgi:peptidoglycan hydrolase-like protein with peptidoglycan-binding domain
LLVQKHNQEKRKQIMKSLHFILFVSLLSVATVFAQGPSTASSPSRSAEAKSSAKRGPIFRANKEQISAAQAKLKSKGLYSGEATGKLDPDTRASIKSYQKDNGLAATGTLNRATLEKMGIALTDSQKAIPASESSYASSKSDRSDDDKPARVIFRATKAQIIEAQKLLRGSGMYAGDETGKLDDPTRDSLKKYQEANGLRATGTLNQQTLEKMGITLTDKQKAGGDSPS